MKFSMFGKGGTDIFINPGRRNLRFLLLANLAGKLGEALRKIK
jgi:hypothetical protein